MKFIPVLLTLCICAATSPAQNQPILGEDTVKVSDHVWAIIGWPNIGIVVGTNATLVVDTGLHAKKWTRQQVVRNMPAAHPVFPPGPS